MTRRCFLDLCHLFQLISCKVKWKDAQGSFLLSVHYLFMVVDEGLVDEAVAAWGGVVAGEVPVALMVGTGCMKAFDGLKDELHRCLHPCRTKSFSHLSVDVINAKRPVNGANTIGLLCCRLAKFGNTSLVDIIY